MIDTRKLLLGLLLLTLAGASWWWTRHVAEPALKPEAAATREPDYVIEKFTADAMNEQGVRKYVLTAQRLTHYPHNETAHLVAPVLVQYLPDGVNVTTRADTGVMPDAGNEILMHGNVHVTRTADPRSPGGEMTANELRVELDR
jgi:lipopolysaccharide export system protein LptC